MLRYVDWSDVDTVIELGGGHGVMTKAIKRAKPKTTKLIACEIDEERYHGLKSFEEEGVEIVHTDATNCLKGFEPNSIDVIVSTLPLGSLDPKISREILKEAAHRLKDNGVFLQYQYFATNKDDIEKYFHFTATDWEPLNFPPAFIYVCKKR